MNSQKVIHQYLTQSKVMGEVFESAKTIAASDGAVLRVGETGVGKEVMAEYIHRNSLRRNKPFIKVGLAALPPELIESELFGHEKGAYTTAINEKKGLFELADKGTIFLDDIDDFPLNLQPKLLRILESGEVLHIGSTRPIPIDIRVISATKIDLNEMSKRGQFRYDLYYRINVVPIKIPPLRERTEDIPMLLEHFIRRYAPDRSLSISPDAMSRLLRYSWPGNVRELRNVSQRLCLFSRESVTLDELPNEIRDENPLISAVKPCLRCFSETEMTFDEALNCLEFNLLAYALKHANGNKSEAARLLKIPLSTFRDKLAKYRTRLN